MLVIQYTWILLLSSGTPCCEFNSIYGQKVWGSFPKEYCTTIVSNAVEKRISLKNFNYFFKINIQVLMNNKLNP